MSLCLLTLIIYKAIIKELIWNSKLFAFCILFFESMGVRRFSFFHKMYTLLRWSGDSPVLLFDSAVISDPWLLWQPNSFIPCLEWFLTHQTKWTECLLPSSQEFWLNFQLPAKTSFSVNLTSNYNLDPKKKKSLFLTLRW